MTNSQGKIDTSLLSSNAIIYRGHVDVTDPQTMTPDVGDLYIVKNPGTIDASWGITGTVQGGEQLLWDGGKWDMVGNNQISIALNDVTDLVTTNKVLEDGDILRYDLNKSRWEASNLDLSSLPDFNVTNPSDYQYMVYDAANNEWVNETVIGRFDKLDDVAVLNPVPNDILGWNGSAWSNGPLYLGNLGNTELSAVADGDGLVYDSTLQKWINKAPSSSPLLAGLTDTEITTPLDNQVLVYDGVNNKWINESAVVRVEDLDNVSLFNLGVNDVLGFDGTNWVNGQMWLGNLGNVEMTGVSDGQILTYDQASNKWVNKTAGSTISGFTDLSDVELTNSLERSGCYI